jgi:hypothetical protein
MRWNCFAVARRCLSAVLCAMLLPAAPPAHGQEEEYGKEQAALAALKTTMELRRGNPYGKFLNPDVLDTETVDLGGPHGRRKVDRAIGLSMNCTYFGDKDVPHVLALTRLRTLWLYGTDISDAGLHELSKLQTIECLLLNRTTITDKGLADLGKMSNLKVLLIGHTKITDAGLRHLGSLRNLVSLDVNNTAVTAAGLQHLRGLENLRVVSMGDGQFSQAEMKLAQQLRPKLRFHIDRL